MSSTIYHLICFIYRKAYSIAVKMNDRAIEAQVIIRLPIYFITMLAKSILSTNLLFTLIPAYRRAIALEMLTLLCETS